MPGDAGNADFRAFLAWNAAQAVPLDYTTPGPAPWLPRPLQAILQDLSGLTTAQKNAIAADLFGGSPPQLLQDAGPNAAALLVLYFQTQAASLSAADKNLARLFAAALYCQDNPRYLLQPTFDPTIQVPGDAPVR